MVVTVYTARRNSVSQDYELGNPRLVFGFFNQQVHPNSQSADTSHIITPLKKVLLKKGEKR